MAGSYTYNINVKTKVDSTALDRVLKKINKRYTLNVDVNSRKFDNFLKRAGRVKKLKFNIEGDFSKINEQFNGLRKQADKINDSFGDIQIKTPKPRKYAPKKEKEPKEEPSEPKSKSEKYNYGYGRYSGGYKPKQRPWLDNSTKDNTGSSGSWGGNRRGSSQSINSALYKSAGTNFSQFGEKYNNFADSIMGIGSLLGGIGLSKALISTPGQAEVNKVLISQMSDDVVSKDSLYNTIDTTTNKLPISMQDLVQPLFAFKSASGASTSDVNDIIPSFANFGAVVQNMTGSTDDAKTAMMKLAYGLDGKYAALDQYGLTEEAVRNAGWEGGENDIKGYMDTVTKIVGDAGATMNTFPGIVASVNKEFSVGGKQLWDDGLGDILKSIVESFRGFNNMFGGLPVKLALLGGAVGTVGSGFVALQGYLQQMVGSLGFAIHSFSKLKNQGLGKTLKSAIMGDFLEEHGLGDDFDYDDSSKNDKNKNKKDEKNTSKNEKKKSKTERVKNKYSPMKNNYNKRALRDFKSFGMKGNRNGFTSVNAKKLQRRGKSYASYVKEQKGYSGVMQYAGKRIKSEAFNLGSSLKSVGSTLSQFGGIIGGSVLVGATALGTAFHAYASQRSSKKNEYNDAIGNLMNRISYFGKSIGAGIGNLFQSLGLSGTGGLDGLVEGVTNIINILSGIMDSVIGIWENITGTDVRGNEKAQQAIEHINSDDPETRKQGIKEYRSTEYDDPNGTWAQYHRYANMGFSRDETKRAYVASRWTSEMDNPYDFDNMSLEGAQLVYKGLATNTTNEMVSQAQLDQFNKVYANHEPEVNKSVSDSETKLADLLKKYGETPPEKEDRPAIDEDVKNRVIPGKSLEDQKEMDDSVKKTASNLNGLYAQDWWKAITGYDDSEKINAENKTNTNSTQNSNQTQTDSKFNQPTTISQQPTINQTALNDTVSKQQQIADLNAGKLDSINNTLTNQSSLFNSTTQNPNNNTTNPNIDYSKLNLTNDSANFNKSATETKDNKNIFDGFKDWWNGIFSSSKNENKNESTENKTNETNSTFNTKATNNPTLGMVSTIPTNVTDPTKGSGITNNTNAENSTTNLTATFDSLNTSASSLNTSMGNLNTTTLNNPNNPNNPNLTTPQPATTPTTPVTPQAQVNTNEPAQKLQEAWNNMNNTNSMNTQSFIMSMDQTATQGANKIPQAITNVAPQVQMAGATLGSSISQSFNLDSLGNKTSQEVQKIPQAINNQQGACSSAMSGIASSMNSAMSGLTIASTVEAELQYTLDVINEYAPQISAAMGNIGGSMAQSVASENHNGSPGDVARLMRDEMGYTLMMIRKETPSILGGMKYIGENLAPTFNHYADSIVPSFGSGNLKSNGGNIEFATSDLQKVGQAPRISNAKSNESNTSNNTPNIVNHFNIDKIDTKERVKEIGETIVKMMTWNNETAGRNPPDPFA